MNMRVDNVFEFQPKIFHQIEVSKMNSADNEWEFWMLWLRAR